MGLFRSQPKPSPQSVDIERMRGHFIRDYGGPPPSFDAVIDDAAARLGVSRADIDEIAAITATYNLFESTADMLASRVRIDGVRAALTQAYLTHGLDDRALWDVLLSYGTSGVAVASILAQQYIADGTIASAVADHLRESGGVQPLAQLPNPGLDPSEPAQIAYVGMSTLGLYSVIHGPGTPNQLIDALYAAAPEFRGSIAGPALHTIDEKRRWIAYWTPDSAAVVVLYLVEHDDDMTPIIRLMDQLETLPAPWSVGAGKVNAMVPRDAQPILAHGQVVPHHAIDGLAAPHHAADRRRIRSLIETDGFVASGPVIYKGTMPGGSAGRTQLLWIAMGEELALYSPIMEGVSEELPAWLVANDFGRYALEALPPFGVLSLNVPLSSPVEQIRAEAAALCRFADECENWLTPGKDDL